MEYEAQVSRSIPQPRLDRDVPMDPSMRTFQVIWRAGDGSKWSVDVLAWSSDQAAEAVQYGRAVTTSVEIVGVVDLSTIR